VRALADKNFALLKNDPRHPSLHSSKLAAITAHASACDIARWRLKPTTACFGSGSDRTPTTMRC